MCSSVNMQSLITAHHEMGHIQYYLQYVNIPPIFRRGANPGFHEAIGDTIALSVATPKYLKAIGLIEPDFELDEKSQLAFLLRMALEKVPFLPYSYILDLYRWKVFNGSIFTNELNAEWWKLAAEFQGIRPPVPRTEDDFDAGAKVHFVRGSPYIKYFVARFLQFDFHQTLCQVAEKFDPENETSLPLHDCEIFGSEAAGDKLRTLMSVGRSEHWPDILERMTGSREMSAKPLLNYFAPLRKYLQDYITRNKVIIGWNMSTDNETESEEDFTHVPEVTVVEFNQSGEMQQIPKKETFTDAQITLQNKTYLVKMAPTFHHLSIKAVEFLLAVTTFVFSFNLLTGSERPFERHLVSWSDVMLLITGPTSLISVAVYLLLGYALKNVRPTMQEVLVEFLILLALVGSAGVTLTLVFYPCWSVMERRTSMMRDDSNGSERKANICLTSDERMFAIGASVAAMATCVAILVDGLIICISINTSDYESKAQSHSTQGIQTEKRVDDEPASQGFYPED
ncbi:unnamed protein product, partial [Notodromas monacha]